MDKADLDAVLKLDTGPIEAHIKALAEENALPLLSAAVCLARIAEAAPALINPIAKAARGEALDVHEDCLLYRGLHLLGGARCPDAFAPLMGLLRRPTRTVELLLGDAITETLPRIVAGTFNGDCETLFDLIEDEAIDEFVRAALLGAATFLTFDKRIARDTFREFLQRFFEQRRVRPGLYVWVAWADAVSLLGERSLAGAVREAFQQGLIDPSFIEVETFETMLAAAEAAPDDIKRFESDHLGYLDDAIDELAVTGGWESDEPGDREDADEGELIDDEFLSEPWPGAEHLWGPPQPAVNPLRHVGRNDPCPCGSGKKFKKCCLS